MELGLISVLAAGVLTLLTPCVLPMLPVYLSMLLGASVESLRLSGMRWRLAASTSFFVLGFSLVFSLLGLVASTVGGALHEQREALLVAGGAVIVVFGLKHLGVLRIGFLDRVLQVRTKGQGRVTGYAGAFMFGVVFALGWTPCVGPILGTVLTYVATTTSSPALGAAYLFSYSLGVGLPLLAVSLAANRWLPQLRKLHRHLPKIERTSGAVMVAVGLALVGPRLGVLWQEWTPASSAQAEDTWALEPSNGQPRLVEFFADGCPTCQRMAPVLDQLETDCIGQRVEVLRVNVSQPRYRHLARAEGIRAVPTIKLFDASGSLTRVLLGERSIPELRAAAAALVGGSCAGERAGRRLQSDGATCDAQLPPERLAAAAQSKPTSSQPAVCEAAASTP